MEQLILNMNTMMERMEAIETQLSKNVEPMKMNDTLVKTVKATKTTSPKEAKAQKSKTPLPWTGIVNTSCCEGLKVNHGLYNQCDNNRTSDSTFCKTCFSQGVKNGSGKPNSSTVHERLESGVMEYTDKRTGKKCVSWIQVLKKLNISLEDAMREASSQEVTIPEEQLVESEKKRGRPKNVSESKSTEGGVGDESPKKRGRPKKEKKEVETVAGDDLIANLVTNFNAEVSSKAEVSLDVDLELKVDGELEEDDVEESTEVRKLTIDGTDYLVDEMNTVYDMESQDEIGTYNSETNSITRDGL